MSIFQSDTKKETSAERSARLIKTRIKDVSLQLTDNWEWGFDEIWHNPDASPQDVLAALGTDAAEVFEFSTALLQMVTTLLQPRLPEKSQELLLKAAQKPKTVTQPDGSVVVI